MDDITQTIINGLTYEGDLRNSLINYGLIAITLVPFLVPVPRQALRPSKNWVKCLLIAVLVQISLWFIADAVGVSVVWSTMAGYELVERVSGGETLAPTPRRLLTAALGCALLGIVYYAVTLPFITTLAHSIAAILGISIAYFFRARRAQPRARTGV